MKLTNSDRRFLNGQRESAKRFYDLFKRAENQIVKRKAGLAYLRITADIRRMEKE